MLMVALGPMCEWGQNQKRRPHPSIIQTQFFESALETAWAQQHKSNCWLAFQYLSQYNNLHDRNLTLSQYQFLFLVDEES